jgi:hypothetical protein
VLHGTLTALRYLQTIKSGKFPKGRDIWNTTLNRNTTIFDFNGDSKPDTVSIPKMDGVVKGGAVEFDLALLGTIGFMLTLGDQNLDGWINCQDDYDVYDLWAGTNLRDSLGAINPDMDVNELKAKFNDPNKLNSYLAMAELLLVTTAQQNMKSTLDSISLVQTATTTSLASSLDGIRNMLNTVGNEITYRKYNDHKDNDYDWWDTDGDGVQDPTVWSDFHKNKKNEFDTLAHPGEYFHLTPFIIFKGPLPHGDLNMEKVNAEKAFDGWPGNYAEGSLVTFRIKLDFRIDSTPGAARDTIFFLNPGSPFYALRNLPGRDDSIGDSTIRVSTLSRGSVAIKFLDTMWTYTIPANSGEFLSGDWGVDEETFDGKDNDGDGMVDEDARNLKGQDDDDDWEGAPDATWVRNRTPAPMVYNKIVLITRIDENNNPVRLIPANDAVHFPDISAYNTPFIATYTSNPSDPARNSILCLGTKNHFLYLWNNHPELLQADSLIWQYYYLNIDKGDTIAYRYRGPHTDYFTGGDWGVDEETLDGCDNDGDGFSDEDVDTTVVAP